MNADRSGSRHAPRLRIPEPTAHTDLATAVSGRYAAVAGAARRPALDEDAISVAPLRDEVIRVIDDDGQAKGDWAGEWSRPELVAGLHDMMLVRAFDARMLRAHRQGKISFYMQSLGEEAIVCVSQWALRPGDMNFPTYRQQGLLVTSDYPMVDMMNQILSNTRDPLKGRQLPVMYSSREHGFFSISGNLATQFVQAVGWAMAAAVDGADAIASAWIGEGVSAESDFHSALVFASTYQAPVILNVVNNQWAISTPEDFARGASATFADRGLGFGIPSLRVDGNDYLAVHAATAWAAERARTGLGPTLIEWITFRVGPHSTSDDPTGYRPDVAGQFPLGDPVQRLRQHMEVRGEWDEERHAQLADDIDRIVATAFEEADSYGSVMRGDVASAATMFDDVFAVMPRHLVEQRAEFEGA